MPVPHFIPLHRLFAEGRAEAHPVYHDGQRCVVWREFAERVAGLSGRLKQLNAKRWLLASDEPQEFLIHLCALLYAGKHVVIPHNTQAGTLAALADAFDARLPDAEHAFACRTPGKLSAIDPHTATIDLYTSGSTGRPKQIRKTLSQIEAELATLESLWGSTLGSAAIVATVPHRHIYGLLFRLLWPLTSGRLFDAATCAHPEALRERLTVLGDSALIASPAQLARWPDLIDPASFTPRPTTVFSSGGPLPAAAAAFYQELACTPIEIFGSTETGGVAWRRQTGAAEDERWTPLPGIGVERAASGALALNSPFVAPSGRTVMDDGIELFADGRFRLLGRLDRTVKIEEKRLSLSEMEMRLGEHPWLDEAALVQLPRRRQRLGAVAVLSPAGRQALAEQGKPRVAQTLRAHLAAHYETVLLPRHWRFPPALPRNERGKTTPEELTPLFTETADRPRYPEVLALSRSPDNAQQLVLDLHVAPRIEHFAGHFPAQAILPGVVQIDWAVHFARQYLALEGRFSALENIKFLGIVLPDSRLQLSLAWDPSNRRLEFAYASGQRKCSSGRLVFLGKA